MAEDLYNVLGLQRSATKHEIKEAFRSLAVKYHPDKHAQSSDYAREEATRRFKQLSHAYDVLIDDKKRAAYNIAYRTGSANRNPGAGAYYSNNTYYSYYQNSYHKPRYRPPPSSNYDGWVSKLDVALRFLTTRAFLLNVAFAGILLGGAVAVDRSGSTLWKMQNSGDPEITMLQEATSLTGVPSNTLRPKSKHIQIYKTNHSWYLISKPPWLQHHEEEKV